MTIAAAIQSSGLTKAAIATSMGVEPSFVSHWATARRPVPADKAAPAPAGLILRQTVTVAIAIVN
jgi:DNA-binding transcriptional regulator YdaS (Cro superfamily)